MGEYQGVGFGASEDVPSDLFILNPFRQHLVTGRRNYVYMARRFGCVGVLITFLLVFMILIGMPRVITEIRLATMKTASGEARIIDHRVTHGKSTTYSVTYQLKVKGQQYDQDETVSSLEYDEWPIGTFVNVTYVVEDPNTSHLGGAGINWLSIIYLPIILMGILIFLFFWWRGSRKERQRIRHLRQEGQIIYGQLKSSRGELFTRGSGKNRHTDYDVSVYCQFVSPTGKKIDATATYIRNDLKKRGLPQSGSMAILYASDNDYLVI